MAFHTPVVQGIVDARLQILKELFGIDDPADQEPDRGNNSYNRGHDKAGDEEIMTPP